MEHNASNKSERSAVPVLGWGVPSPPNRIKTFKSWWLLHRKFSDLELQCLLGQNSETVSSCTRLGYTISPKHSHRCGTWWLLHRKIQQDGTQMLTWTKVRDQLRCTVFPKQIIELFENWWLLHRKISEMELPRFLGHKSEVSRSYGCWESAVFQCLDLQPKNLTTFPQEIQQDKAVALFGYKGQRSIAPVLSRSTLSPKGGTIELCQI